MPKKHWLMTLWEGSFAHRKFTKEELRQIAIDNNCCYNYLRNYCYQYGLIDATYQRKSFVSAKDKIIKYIIKKYGSSVSADNFYDIAQELKISVGYVKNIVYTMNSKEVKYVPRETLNRYAPREITRECPICKKVIVPSYYEGCDACIDSEFDKYMKETIMFKGIEMYKNGTFSATIRIPDSVYYNNSRDL